MAGFHPLVLLTDFGTRDAYVASMKGVILNLFPQAVIVDLTHEVEPQNVRQAAFLLEAAYRYFPKESIFVCVVDPGVGSQRKILAVRTPQGIFVAPDNGLLTRVLDREKPLSIRWVNNPRFFLSEVSATFHGRDCFAPTGARLAQDTSRFSLLGPRLEDYRRLAFPKPQVKGKGLTGEILCFDHFGNAFTNISLGALRRWRGRPPHGVRIRGKSLGTIRRSYFEVEKGRAVCVVSSSGYLEIAVNHGSAREKLKLKEGTRIEIS